jgi:hypothetical protein
MTGSMYSLLLTAVVLADRATGYVKADRDVGILKTDFTHQLSNQRLVR